MSALHLCSESGTSTRREIEEFMTDERRAQIVSHLLATDEYLDRHTESGIRQAIGSLADAVKLLVPPVPVESLAESEEPKGTVNYMFSFRDRLNECADMRNRIESLINMHDRHFADCACSACAIVADLRAAIGLEKKA